MARCGHHLRFIFKVKSSRRLQGSRKALDSFLSKLFALLSRETYESDS